MDKGTKPKEYYRDRDGVHPLFVLPADVAAVAADLEDLAGAGRTTETVKGNADAIATAVPPGVIWPYGGTAAPSGFLLCNGASISRTAYAALFAIIGTAYGTADGNSFNVPDFRGRFLRGRDEATGRDPNAATRTAMATGGNTGDNVGSIQADAMQGHRHPPLGGGVSPNFWVAVTSGGVEVSSSAGTLRNLGGATTGDPVTDTVNGTPRTAAETRPINAYVNYIIKT